MTLGIAKALSDKIKEPAWETYAKRVEAAKTVADCRAIGRDLGADGSVSVPDKEGLMDVVRARIATLASSTTLETVGDLEPPAPAKPVLTEIVPAAASVVLFPVAKAGEMRAAIEAWTALVNEIEMPGDVVMIGKGDKAKPYRKVAFYRRAAAAYNLTVKVLSKSSTSGWGPTKEKPTAEVHLRISAPNGRYIDSIGLANGNEPNKGEMSEHAIVALAWTRAFARGCRTIIGFGEPAAEEVEESDEQ